MTELAAGAADEGQALRGYARLKRQRLLLIGLLAACGVGVFLLDLGTGPAGIAPLKALSALVGLADPPPAQEVILWQLRLPVALMAILVGASLALAGAEMQTVLANPLAEPFTLGVSNAAALGAALAIVFGLGGAWLPANLTIAGNAFLFAAGSLLLIQLLARLSDAGAETLVLFGIALGFTASALLWLVQYMASADALQQIVFWSMGSLTRTDWTVLPIAAAVLCIVAPFSLAAAWKLTALRLGEERAISFGLDTRRLRLMALVRASLLAATSVAFVGVIGFVGLVAPHVARMLVGEDHRYFLPASLITGALTVSAASIATKLIVPGLMLPIGIVTALVGLPGFVWLVLRRHRRAR
ncbi:FecCD family ABC transporter permease [Nitratireductor thuwali]|uniref:Hemin transport system permease protein HmuU n=1 Tax=Nitratireductor thuwali TaxID=2267699 RepID=A0ABY5MMC9_9HYPH|nr:Hemin transport system permease protein HmuU [Nitratireductor thuwali]